MKNISMNDLCKLPEDEYQSILLKNKRFNKNILRGARSMYVELNIRGDAALSEYKTSKHKMLIQCGNNPDHKYMIRPNNYKTGVGCPKCSGCCPEQARDDMYKELAKRGDIALDDYKKATTKMKICCGNNPNHVFMIEPHNYKRGQGCPKCGGNCTEQSRDNMYKEMNKRGDRALSEYKTNKCKMQIQCGKNSDHVFMMAPSHYKHGHGCPKCAGLCSNQSRDAMYKELAKRGDIALSEYTTANKKMMIRCGKNPDHIFEMIPSSYKRGHKCPKCSNHCPNQSRDDMYKELDKRGDAALSEYTTTDKKMKIICGRDASHVFSMSPHDYKAGHGCPKCAKFGYQPSNLGYLYIMRAVESGDIKIGISNIPNERMFTLTKRTPFNFDRIELLCWRDGKIAQQLEKHLHSLGTNAGLHGFDGATEWYKYDQSLIDAARKYKKAQQIHMMQGDKFGYLRFT